MQSGRWPDAANSYMSPMGGGEGRIRTSEGFAGRFTVCSLWPLGNLSRNPITLLGQASFYDYHNKKRKATIFFFGAGEGT